MKKIFDLTIDEKHSDVEILGSSLKSMGFKFDTQWYIKNNEIVRSEKPTLRGSSHSTDTAILEGNYIRIISVDSWSDTEHKKLLEAIELANTTTSEYKFEYGDISDYEVEWDNDRSWPASFTFYSHKKLFY